YGFMVRLGELYARNKAGKAVLAVPENARVLPPVPVGRETAGRVAAVTNTGRLLMFPLGELPQLARGKGNKIIGIPGARAKAREEYVAALACVPEGAVLTLYSGQRHLTLKPADMDGYLGERGQRGGKLPRGFQRVERMVAGET
ncbi:MAG: DNA topoisomerase IV subunit A, partial [Gammaproteobacteria bacterium]|nr:DNA topoisomerase IV subunit A [Gammaproteobacteria bacterium]